MNFSLTTHTAEETRALGQKQAKELLPGTLLCLKGELGAGKTTFIQGLLEGLGALRPYTSPTFVLMKQYDLPLPTKTGIRRVYHADAYRVTAKDFAELGFAEWCSDPEGLVLLEWPERLEEILPPARVEMTITSLSETTREIMVRSQ